MVISVNQMLGEKQEVEREMSNQLQKLEAEKQEQQLLLASLQHKLASLEAGKKDAERSAIRLQHDKKAMKKSLNKVTRPLFKSSMKKFYEEILSLGCFFRGDTIAYIVSIETSHKQ